MRSFKRNAQALLEMKKPCKKGVRSTANEGAALHYRNVAALIEMKEHTRNEETLLYVKKLSSMSQLTEMTEIYENEAQKICKKRPTGQEMEELYKKRGISTRNEEALKKPGMRKVSKKERGLKHKNEEVLDLMRKFHKKSGNLQRRDFKKK